MHKGCKSPLCFFVFYRLGEKCILRILFVSDIVGKPGIEVLKKELKGILLLEDIDLVIANAENSADGFGIYPKIAVELFQAGVNIITLGNHTFDKKEVLNILDDKRIVRPINYPDVVGGRGYTFCTTEKGKKVAIINVLGQIFMNPINSPFLEIGKILDNIKKETNIIFVDFHAEATSEKKAFGYFLDGKVSAVVGTHTHVATSDETILSGGTAYITDAGMTGSENSVIGMKKEKILQKFLTGMHIRYEVSDEKGILEGVIIEIDENSGKAKSIKRIKKGYL